VSEDGYEYTEQVIEVGRENVLVIKRTKDGVTEYCFDVRKELWNSSMPDAYTSAEAAGRLLSPKAVNDGDGGLEAFMLSLLIQCKALQVGESIKVTRREGSMVVSKEEILLATRASNFDDFDASMGDTDGGN